MVNACLFLQQAFRESLDPDMLIQVLEVLRLERMGKAMHADKMEQAYHEELDKHIVCENCPKGTAL